MRDSATEEWLNTLGTERSLRQDAEARVQVAEAMAQLLRRETGNLQAELERLRQGEE